MVINEVKWVLANLLELRRGDWPDPEWYELDRSLHKISFLEAKFAPCELAAGVESRLSACGIDGFLVKQMYAWGEDVGYLTKNLNISRVEIIRGIEAAMDYITDKWPKTTPYRRYRTTHKGGRND